MAEPVELVLFNLSGVLIEVSGVRAILELAGIESEQELWRRWLTAGRNHLAVISACTPSRTRANASQVRNQP